MTNQALEQELPPLDVTEEDWKAAYAMAGFHLERTAVKDKVLSDVAKWMCRERQLKAGRESHRLTLQREAATTARYDAKIDALEADLRAAQGRVEEVGRERDEAFEVAYHSERWRQAYQKGKHELYAMGGAVAEAAFAHLPCNEGQLDRKSRRLLIDQWTAPFREQLIAAESELSRLREVGQWVSTQERLPEWGEWCFVVIGGVFQKTPAFLDPNNEWNWADEDADLAPLTAVSHWVSEIDPPSEPSNPAAPKPEGTA